MLTTEQLCLSPPKVPLPLRRRQRQQRRRNRQDMPVQGRRSGDVPAVHQGNVTVLGLRLRYGPAGVQGRLHRRHHLRRPRNDGGGGGPDRRHPGAQGRDASG